VQPTTYDVPNEELHRDVVIEHMLKFIQLEFCLLNQRLLTTSEFWLGKWKFNQSNEWSL